MSIEEKRGPKDWYLENCKIKRSGRREGSCKVEWEKAATKVELKPGEYRKPQEIYPKTPRTNKCV